MNTYHNKMRIRPRFKEEIAIPPESLKTLIAEALKRNRDFCIGNIIKNHVILSVPKSNEHYWSPQLNLELEDNEGGTLIRGLFGPKPGVWTMFVFFYSAIGFLTMMGLIFGLSQMMLKMHAYGLWSVPVGLILLLGLFISSKIGQRLGYEQMTDLRQFLDEIIKMNS